MYMHISIKIIIYINTNININMLMSCPPCTFPQLRCQQSVVKFGQHLAARLEAARRLRSETQSPMLIEAEISEHFRTEISDHFPKRAGRAGQQKLAGQHERVSTC